MALIKKCRKAVAIMLWFGLWVSTLASIKKLHKVVMIMLLIFLGVSTLAWIKKLRQVVMIVLSFFFWVSTLALIKKLRNTVMIMLSFYFGFQLWFVVRSRFRVCFFSFIVGLVYSSQIRNIRKHYFKLGDLCINMLINRCKFISFYALKQTEYQWIFWPQALNLGGLPPFHISMSCMLTPSSHGNR